jgi:hypothetical protein
MVDAWSGCAALLRCGAHICADQSSDPKGYGNHQIRALSAGRRAGPEMEKLLSDSKLHAVVKRNSLFDVASSQYVSKINEFRLNGPSGQSFDQRHVVVSAQYIRLPTHINTLNSGVRIGNKIFAVKVDCDNSESRLFSSKSIYAAHLSRPQLVARPARSASPRWRPAMGARGVQVSNFTPMLCPLRQITSQSWLRKSPPETKRNLSGGVASGSTWIIAPSRLMSHTRQSQLPGVPLKKSSPLFNARGRNSLFGYAITGRLRQTGILNKLQVVKTGFVSVTAFASNCTLDIAGAA